MKLVKQPTLGLFLHEGQPYWSGPSFPEHYPEDEQPLANFPVIALFDCVDFGNGDGWGRSAIEQHSKILQVYCHNVGNGHENYAVLVEVEKSEDLRVLLANYDCLENVPDEL